MIRHNSVYIVVTVNKRTTNFVLRQKTPALNPNQMGFKVKMDIDDTEWFNRIREINLGKMSPPLPAIAVGVDVEIGKTTSQRVLDRITGK